MSKQLTDDYLKWTLDVDNKPAQKALSDLSNNTNELKSANKGLATEMEKLRAKGRENSEEFKTLKKRFDENNRTIAQSEEKMRSLRKEIGINSMSARELRKHMSDLKKVMDGLNPETKEWKEYNKQLQTASQRSNELRGSTSKVNGMFGELKSLLPALGIGAVIGGIVSLAKSIIETRREFEKYEAILTTSLGSHQKASAAMQMLAGFASTTNFQLTELTENFVKFSNRGLVLSQEQMTKMADVANSTGKSFGQLSEAILDINNSERWKELGIKVKTTGDKVELSFKGMTETVAKTEAGVLSAIQAFGEMPGVMGMTAKISQTLDGQMSNLGDSIDQLYNGLGEGKLGGAIKSVVGWFGGMVDKAREWLTVPTSEKLQQEQADLNVLVNSITSVNDNQRLRNDLVKELQTTYPDFLGNLDAEKVTNEQLFARLKEVNGEYLKKIKMASLEEEVTRLSKERGKIFLQERETIKKINAEYEKLVQNKKGEIAIDDKLAAIAKTSSAYMVGTQEQVMKNDNMAAGLKNRVNMLRDQGITLEKELSELLVEQSQIAPPAIEKTEKAIQKVVLTEKELEKVRKAAQKALEDRLEFENNLQKASISQLETWEKDAEKQWEKLTDFVEGELISQVNAEGKANQDSLDAFAKKEEDHINKVAEAKDRVNSLREVGVADEILRLNALRDKIKADYAAGLISEEEYQEGIKQIKIAKIIEISKITQQYSQQALDLSNAFEDAGLAASEARKARELKNAGDDANKKKAIEEKYEAEQKKIKKKYADINFVLQVAQIGASTAQAAINAFQSLAGIPIVGPVLGGIAAAAATAFGIAQISKAKSERDKIKQLYTGRYNVTGASDGRQYNNLENIGTPKTGVYNSPVLIADHGGEAVIDAYRTRQLTMYHPAVFDFIKNLPGPPVKQYADGNLPNVSSGSYSSNQAKEDMTIQTMAALNSSISTLNDRIQNIRAYINQEEFAKAQNERNARINDITRK